jgi:hypothetical protein
MRVSFVIAAVLFLSGCGEDTCKYICCNLDGGQQADGAVQTDSQVIPCEAGSTRACTCEGGLLGYQECSDGGDWLNCQCTESCGNGTCDPSENETTCPQDCATSYCGDGTCDPGETTQNCAVDCPDSCGNGSCEVGETEVNCPEDCAVPSECLADKWYCDGDQVRICTSDGATSVLFLNCPTEQQVHTSCGYCAATDRSFCKSPDPYCFGTVTGLANIAFSEDRPPSACEGNGGCIFFSNETYQGTQVGFTHYLANGEGTVSITFYILPTSGLSIPLHGTEAAPNSNVYLYVNRPMVGPICRNSTNYSAYSPTQPPLGTITITYPDLNIGSTAIIAANGHLTCDDGATWEAFTANYTARFTQ